jgi:hypothetical protein
MARRITEAGKAASSVNAVKHGLRSNAPVISEIESFEDWERHRAAIIATWEPESGFETFLAEPIASLSWRLNRVPRYETEMTAHHIDSIPDDLADTSRYGEKLGIPREETVTMDKIGELISQRLLPPRDPRERIVRTKATFTASSSRPSASSKPPRPAAKATAHPPSPA